MRSRRCRPGWPHGRSRLPRRGGRDCSSHRACERRRGGSPGHGPPHQGAKGCAHGPVRWRGAQRRRCGVPGVQLHQRVCGLSLSGRRQSAAARPAAATAERPAARCSFWAACSHSA
jgi:hypothetical protein